jgi:hypothetical protein
MWWAWIGGISSTSAIGRQSDLTHTVYLSFYIDRGPYRISHAEDGKDACDLCVMDHTANPSGGMESLQAVSFSQKRGMRRDGSH